MIVGGSLRTRLDGHELAAIRAHLGKFKHHTCPVCGSKEWTVTPPQTTVAYRIEVGPTPATIGEGPSIPVAVVVCGTCFFVRHFAWRPIWQAYLASISPSSMPGPTVEGGGGD